MDVARVDPSLVDEGAIGFRLAPRLNAAGRLYRADAGLELLLTADPERARAVAAELDAVNSERRDVETRIRFEAEALLAEQSSPGAPAHVLAGEGWHPGVIGIVAARIAERHYRPTVLIALDGDEGSGSGRSIPGFDLLAGLEAGADELLRHGGHRAAAGLTIARNRVERFREAFVAHAAAHAHPGRPRRHRARRRGRARRHAAARARRGARAAQAVRLRQPRRLAARARRAARRPAADGGGPPRRVLARGRRRPLALRAPSAPAARSRPQPGEPVDAAVRLEANRYNGTTEPRLVLRCAQPAAPKPIDVIGEPARGATGVLRRARPRPDGTRRPAAAATPARGAARARSASAWPGCSATSSPPASRCSSSPPTRRTARGRCSGRVGGFAVTSWAALEDDPGLAREFAARRRAGPARARPPARAARTSAGSGLDPPGLGRR